MEEKNYFRNVKNSLLALLILFITSFLLVTNTYAAEVNVKIATGRSLEFKNTSYSTEKLTIGNGKGDYVVYTSSGTVYSQYASSSDSIIVPAQYTVMVTATYGENAMHIAYDNEKFSYKTSEVPAMSRQSIIIGETYEFKNTSNSELKLLGSGTGLIDCVIYNADGSLSKQIFSSYLYPDGSLKFYATSDRGECNVPAGGKAVITVAKSGWVGESGKVVISAAYMKTEQKKLQNPVMLRQPLNVGEVLEITNISDRDILAVNDGNSGRIYAFRYGANGEIINNNEYSMDYIANVYGANGIDVPVDGKIVVVVNDEDMLLVIPYGKAEVKTLSSPALLTRTLAVGDTGVFTNTSNREFAVEVENKGRLDSVVYNADGTIVNGQITVDEITSRFKVPAGGTVVVTSAEKEIKLVAPYGKFERSTSSATAMLRETLSTGETVVFANKSNQIVSVLDYGDGIAEIVSYKADGSISFENDNCILNDGVYAIPVPAGGKIVIKSLSTDEVKFAAPYTHFEFGTVNTNTVQVSILVQKDGVPVAGASVIMGTEEKFTDSNGVATFTVNKDSSTNYYVSMKNFGTKLGTVKVNESNVNASVELPVFQYGDVNGDGNTTIADVSLSYQKLRGKIFVSEHTVKSMDVNKDGKLSITDITLIYSRSRGKIPSFN